MYKIMWSWDYDAKQDLCVSMNMLTKDISPIRIFSLMHRRGNCVGPSVQYMSCCIQVR